MRSKRRETKPCSRKERVSKKERHQAMHQGEEAGTCMVEPRNSNHPSNFQVPKSQDSPRPRSSWPSLSHHVNLENDQTRNFLYRRPQGPRESERAVRFPKRGVKQNVLCIIYYLLTIVYYAVCNTSRDARYLSQHPQSSSSSNATGGGGGGVAVADPTAAVKLR